MKSESSPPILQAIVLADHVYTVESGKRVICGTFQHVWSSRFPTIFSRPTWVFMLLADVVQSVRLQLRFVHLKDNRILMQSSVIEIPSTDPLTPLDIAMQVPPFPLPEPGAYSMECYADDTMIGSVRLRVSQRDLNQEKSND